jgi:hypothetical protein
LSIIAKTIAIAASKKRGGKNHLSFFCGCSSTINALERSNAPIVVVHAKSGRCSAGVSLPQFSETKGDRR